MKRSIVWLASYPKSGNTWVRIFLANYMLDRDVPLPINEVRRFGTGDALTYYYRKLARQELDPNDWQAVVRLRLKVLRAIVANNADINLVKTHNMSGVINGVNLVPTELTKSAVYIIRNPLDMVLSYASHFGLTHASAVDAIGRSDNVIMGDTGSVVQFLGTWSDHVSSWTKHANRQSLILRYEDLLDEPEKCFSKLLKYIGVPIQDERLDRAIRFSQFDELVEQEQTLGFGEKSAFSSRFFGVGKSGRWKDELAPDLVKQIRRQHKRVMKQYGYWNE